MGDVGEMYRELREDRKEKGKNNLAFFNKDGWQKHTDYHYSRTIKGKRLDYWPSKKKFQYEGKIMTGDVFSFIKKHDA